MYHWVTTNRHPRKIPWCICTMSWTWMRFVAKTFATQCIKRPSNSRSPKPSAASCCRSCLTTEMRGFLRRPTRGWTAFLLRSAVRPFIRWDPFPLECFFFSLCSLESSIVVQAEFLNSYFRRKKNQKWCLCCLLTQLVCWWISGYVRLWSSLWSFVASTTWQHDRVLGWLSCRIIKRFKCSCFTCFWSGA